MNIDEYNIIIKDILSNDKVLELDNHIHHKTTRLTHSKRVSYYSYLVCKKLNLDYVSTARGGLLHDFFLNSYSDEKSYKLLRNHPLIAYKNASKYFKLNNKEKNIIESHMFPINIKYIPKYKESYIVSIVDKIVGVYENIIGYTNEIKILTSNKIVYILILLMLNY